MATLSDSDSESSFHGFTSEALEKILQHHRTLDITLDEISIDELDCESDEDFSSEDDIPIGQLQRKSTTDVSSPSSSSENNIGGTTRSLVQESEAVDTNVGLPIDRRPPGEHIPRSTEKSRKRVRETSKWKKNTRKKKRNEGLAYVGHRGVSYSSRSFQRVCCKCPFNCSDQFDLNDQEDVFRGYWGLKDFNRQRDYIVSHVHKQPVRRQTTNTSSRRGTSLHYHLSLGSEKIRVCKSFFLGTLGIGERTVHYTIKHKVNNLGTCDADRRGRHAPSTKLSHDDKVYVRQHIESFPVMDSHYCRESSNRQYLDKDLSISEMYRQYLLECTANQRQPVKKHAYQKIFNEEYNLSFHKPKKDLCSICDRWSHLSSTEKALTSEKEARDAHLKRKEDIRTSKENDKEEAKRNVQVHTIAFDLQKVLQTPKCNVSDLYYSRKLSTYNFSTCNLATNEATCYMWHETQAKRGSCEISTCVFKENTKAANAGQNDLRYYSDSCGGQQRNIAFSTMCLYSVNKLPIQTITHTYLEKGHSQSEVDSVHARIEKSTKQRNIYIPSDWFTEVENAKVSEPKYHVHEITTNDVLDFKSLASDVICNRKTTESGETIRWLDIHQMKNEKGHPNTVFFKYSISQPSFDSFNINGRRRHSTHMLPLTQREVQPLYRGRQDLPISILKVNDLKKLCTKGHIPQRYHAYYHSLSSDNSNVTLPEPDEDETPEMDN